MNIVGGEIFISVCMPVVIVCTIILLLRIFAKLLRPSIQGNIGELIVADYLRELPSDEYKVINDVILPTVDGITTQVDHIVVSKFGIFVIETKKYSGWIFGNEKQRQWTQTLSVGYDSEKFHFNNPIKQNWRHIYTMSDILKLPRYYFFNVVVFCDCCEFMTDIPDNVIYSYQLKDYIQRFNRPLMSAGMVEKVVYAIVAWDVSVDCTKKESHVNNLMVMHDDAQLSILCERGKLKCPKCGAKMVLRHRKSDNASFYGCSKYPACNGIRRAME